MGAFGSVVGETVFTTGMTGYLETLTDPSYYGQIVTQTFPLVGNYGVIPEDFESAKSWVRGYIVRELCDGPSNFRCKQKLSDFLKAQNIVGIRGVDTRALTKKIRESGVMNGMIVSGQEAEKLDFRVKPCDVCEANSCNNDSVIPALDAGIIERIRAYKIERAVESVQGGGIEGESLPPASRSAAPTPPSAGTPRNAPASSPHIVLWDFGAKANIQRELQKRGCRVTVVPCGATAGEILALNPDGLMLSNGPGDPADNVGIIEEIKKICDAGSLPIFGICLGHQMLALARGCKTTKLKYGHRGANHPCKDMNTGRVYITSQNHGYAVQAESVPANAKISFTNVNDQTVEGLRYTDIPAFSVQFHPEACGGPHDTNFLFDEFLQMIGRSKEPCR